jgi:DNA-binding FadR family transcriptional regulator
MTAVSYVRVPSGHHGQIGQPVRAPKTSELIATQLRRQIVRGAVQAGEKLPPETRLMEQFGVSRPTIREAFRILETEGLIVVTPDQTAAVRHVGLLLQLRGATVDDVYEARKIAEPACAAMLARCRTEQDIADLAAVVAEIDFAVEARDGQPDPTQWTRLSYRFHELIMQRSGNKTLALQGAMLHDIVATHTEVRASRSFGETGSPERFRRAVQSYKQLLALVEAGDADGAERMWRSHMDAAATFLLKDDLGDKPVVELFA